MKKTLFAALILGISCFVVSSCEKDDICSQEEPTTPSLVVEFFDYLDQEVPNNGLVRAYVVGEPDHIIQSNSNKIILPLRLDASTTSWVLEISKQDQDQVSVFKDTLSFAYQVHTKYLNKACGYVSTFSLNQDGSSPLLNGKKQSTGNWIKQYQTQKNEITDQNEAHLKIFY
ncbi:DUF6452 family protein [Myroides sp. LJL119]